MRNVKNAVGNDDEPILNPTRPDGRALHVPARVSGASSGESAGQSGNEVTVVDKNAGHSKVGAEVPLNEDENGVDLNLNAGELYGDKSSGDDDVVDTNGDDVKVDPG